MSSFLLFTATEWIQEFKHLISLRGLSVELLCLFTRLNSVFGLIAKLWQLTISKRQELIKAIKSHQLVVSDLLQTLSLLVTEG